MLRGDDAGLVSGAMFSGDQANKRAAKMKVDQFCDLMTNTLKAKGLEVEMKFYRNFTSREWNITHGETKIRRSTFDGDIASRDPRGYAIQTLAEIFKSLDIPFSPPDDVTEVPPIEIEVSVDTVGRPPGVSEEVEAPVMSEPVVSDAGNELVNFEAMTIREMKAWAKENEIKIPWDMNRRDDLIEFLNEHTDGG